MPRSWQYMPFDNFSQFVKKFKKTPLSDENADGKLDESQELLFQAASTIDKRVFVDWKVIMIGLTLWNSMQGSTA